MFEGILDFLKNTCEGIINTFNLYVLQMQQSFVLRYSKLWQQKVINMELIFLWELVEVLKVS